MKSVARRLWLVALTASVLLAHAPARADALADLIGGLAADGFADKEKAIEALAALGDGRAVPALKALADGRLQVTAEKRVVIADPDGPAKDAVTLADLGKLDGLERVRVNNRLRGTISGALSRLLLFSPAS